MHKTRRLTRHTLTTGWNLIGIPVPADRLQATDIVASARDLESGAYRVREVDRWMFGSYQAYVAGYLLNDFPIHSDRAYFLRTVEPFQRTAPVTGSLTTGCIDVDGGVVAVRVTTSLSTTCLDPSSTLAAPSRPSLIIADQGWIFNCRI